MYERLGLWTRIRGHNRSYPRWLELQYQPDHILQQRIDHLFSITDPRTLLLEIFEEEEVDRMRIEEESGLDILMKNLDPFPYL